MIKLGNLVAALIGFVALLAVTAAPAAATEGATAPAAVFAMGLPPVGQPDLTPLALGVSLLSSAGVCLHGRIRPRS
ncbi:MAG: hypothetical protein HY690_00510 [Chloroflexi bacterium]|nr:hypothetical protein [Chloroflexota bacterium]